MLRRRRLGDVRFAQGEVEIASQPSLVVATEGRHGRQAPHAPSSVMCVTVPMAGRPDGRRAAREGMSGPLSGPLSLLTPLSHASPGCTGRTRLKRMRRFTMNPVCGTSLPTWLPGGLITRDRVLVRSEHGFALISTDSPELSPRTLIAIFPTYPRGRRRSSATVT